MGLYFILDTIMIAILAAVAENGVIGVDNDLPWHLPEDLKKFKELTTGKVVVMGRKTYESIIKRLGKPLPNRKNVVITRQTGYKALPDVDIFYNLEDALNANKSNDIFIIGGGEIFKQSIDKANMMYITHVHETYEGDSRFPKIDMKNWKLIEEEKRNGFSFAIYKRR